MRRCIALAVATVVLLAGCRIYPSVTSGDDPATAVPLSWSLNESPRPDGHRLRFYGGTMHSIPGSLRVVTPSGQVVASGTATFSASGGGLCGDTQAVGTARAELPLPAAEVAAFRSGWPAGYRVEAEVGGTWRPAALTHAGCTTAE
jgi:hypothetical protein